MKTKHTPTPWAYHEGADTVDGYKTFDIHRNNGRCDCAEWIATVTSVQSDFETAQANAQFIALACNHHEELLSTLKDVQVFARLSCPHGVDRDLWQSTFDRVESILTKLKG